MKKRSKKELKQSPQPSPSMLTFIICVSISLIMGLLYWYYLSRCDDKSCYHHYFPFGELLVFGLAGWLSPYIIVMWRTENKKNKRRKI